MGKYHNVLYIGLKIAWDWGVTDSDVVKNLLRTKREKGRLIWINYARQNTRLWHTIMTFLLYKSPHFIPHIVCRLLAFTCRWNFPVWAELWAFISWCYIWFKCAILHCRMEKRFFRPGQMQKPPNQLKAYHLV